jgi:23S rRNA (cytidine1920-2'-O)/16S rRNA (cytidine1409-2'-O)-methyltransferase
MEILAAAARSEGELLLLVKPQFEAAKHEVDKSGGVISDPVVRRRCIDEVADSLSNHGARVIGEVESGTPGPAGNLEHWLRAIKV